VTAQKNAIVSLIVVLTVAMLMIPSGCRQQQPGSAQVPAATKMTIQQIGSTTLLDLANEWREDFNKTHPDVRLAVSGGGSGTGIQALINGTAQIANASRPMTDGEKRRAAQAGIEPVEHIAAYDGMAIIIHPSNPVDKLSIQQLSDIFSGKTKNWSAVGGPDKEIVLINRDSSSGTYQVFKELVVQMDGTAVDRDYAPEALAMQSNQMVVESVANSKTAIGYCGLGYLVPRVKPLSVTALGSREAVAPGPENVQDGSYPISRPLYMYTDGEPIGPLADYFQYVRGPGQRIVEELGFVGISE